MSGLYFSHLLSYVSFAIRSTYFFLVSNKFMKEIRLPCYIDITKALSVYLFEKIILKTLV